MQNILSIDLEDWFHVNSFNSIISFADWHKYPSRIEDSTNRLLKILCQYHTSATFFILGYVAEHYPQLIKRIHEEGHEVATHGYSHTLIYTQKPDQFKLELSQSIKMLEEITGYPVLGHRAASWSITEQSLWALKIIRDLGLKYDSSIFPTKNYQYGIPNAPTDIHKIYFDDNNPLIEIPPSTINCFGKNLPFGGGFFFRVWPYRLTSWAIRTLNKIGRVAVIYLHPWELDPYQPRLPISFKKHLIHYLGLKNTERKLRRLLSEFRFNTVQRVYNISKE